MTTFGWKRKAGEKLSKNTTKLFGSDDESSEIPNNDDWLGNFKRRKIIFLEDSERKAERLKDEGALLAENERLWEAIKKWDEAIQLTPDDSSLYEMKAQALMQVNEIFPAVEMAEKAVELNPTWWVAYQTLGRAQLGIGEIVLAIKSFSKALHLNPASEELWREDLEWARKLLEKKHNLETNEYEEKAASDATKLVFDEEGFIVGYKDDVTHNSSQDKNLVKCRF